jgi:hypothetical protein
MTGRFCKSVTAAASPPALMAASLHGLEDGRLGRVGAAENQADVGMRDQMTRAIQHEGVAGLAYMDGRDHIPNKLEVDLSDRGAGARAGAGHCDRHIGLRRLVQDRWAVPDPLAERAQDGVVAGS